METKRPHNHKRQISTSNKELFTNFVMFNHAWWKGEENEVKLFSVLHTENLTCELPQFLPDFGDYACKLKNYIILSQFVICWMHYK